MPLPCVSTLPVVSADFCDLNTAFGQISKLYFTRVGDGLTLVTSLVEWNARLSNSIALPASPALAPIRTLFVIGSLGEGESTPVPVSLGREVSPLPKNTLSFYIDDVGTENYAFAKAVVAAGSGIWTVWFEAGGYLFGDNDGTEITMRLFYDIPEADTDLQRIRGTLTWKGGMVTRNASPFA